MNLVIEEKRVSLVEVSLVWRHLPKLDLNLVPASFVCQKAVRVVRTTTSRHYTQRREGGCARHNHAAIQRVAENKFDKNTLSLVHFCGTISANMGSIFRMLLSSEHGSERCGTID